MLSDDDGLRGWTRSQEMFMKPRKADKSCESSHLHESKAAYFTHRRDFLEIIIERRSPWPFEHKNFGSPSAPSLSCLLMGEAFEIHWANRKCFPRVSLKSHFQHRIYRLRRAHNNNLINSYGIIVMEKLGTDACDEITLGSSFSTSSGFLSTLAQLGAC